MKPNTYLVSKKLNRTVIHKQIDGEGELREMKSLNLVMNSNDMSRLQEAFNQAAKDELEKQQQAE